VTNHRRHYTRKSEQTMIVGRVFIRPLTMAACTPAAYTIGRYTRQLGKRQFKNELRAWEDEDGHLAPPEALSVAHIAAAA
jgi:hypothetical protein